MTFGTCERPWLNERLSVGHRWQRHEAPLPALELAADPALAEDLLLYIKAQQRASKASQKATPLSLTGGSSSSRKPPSRVIESKFLKHACLPQVYAENWGRQIAATTAPRRSARQEEVDVPGPNACCVVESPVSLVVVLQGGHRDKLPPRTWLLLESSSQSQAQQLTPSVSNFDNMPAVPPEQIGNSQLSEEEDEHLDGLQLAFESTRNLLRIEGLGYCQLAAAAGSGCYLEEQDGINLLRMVPESRLHSEAAEANFRRASGGNSVTALRHAALIAELLVDRERPGLNPINRRLMYAFPPAESQQHVQAMMVKVATEPQNSPRMPGRSLQAASPCLPRAGCQDAPEIPHILPKFQKALATYSARASTAGSSAASGLDSPRQQSPARSRRASPETRAATAGSASNFASGGAGWQTARAARLESLVCSRAAAAERCANLSQTAREHAFNAADIDKHEIFGKSTLQKGFQALQEFLDFTNRRFGNPVRTWFTLDPEANMKIGERQFERQCMEIGFKGNIPALWRYLEVSIGTGVVGLLQLHPPSAFLLARLKVLIREKFEDRCINFFHYLDEHRRHRVDRQTFMTRTKMIGFEASPKLFELLDRRRTGVFTEHDLKFLDLWRLPPYIYEEPNRKAFKAFLDKLMEVHGHTLRAWRKIDRDGTMRVTFDEFRATCAEMIRAPNRSSASLGSPNFPRTDTEIAAAWRAADEDCTGFMTVRMFDRTSHDTLAEFKKWCDRTHGGVLKAFRNLDISGVTGSNAKLSEAELKRIKRGDDPCMVDVEFLFDGLDVNNNMALSENDVKFLDSWDLAWEEWEYTAKAAARRRTKHGLDRRNSIVC